MDNLTAPHSTSSAYCRCGRCSRDRVVLSALSPRIARILRQAIASSR